MTEDPTERLERLSELHRRGELSDDEFAKAKGDVLANGGVTTVAAPLAPRAGSTDERPSTAPSRLAQIGATRPRMSHSHRFWRNPWIVAVAVFLGFMYAAAGTAIAPSSASWTSGIVCNSPYHLVHTTSSTRIGFTKSQEAVGFECVSGSSTKDASTISIFGLQFLLGAVLLYAVVSVIGLAWQLASRRS